MTSAFSLALYPWTFVAQSDGNGGWRGTYHERHHLSPAEESALPPAELDALLVERNWIPGLSLVNYTTQYGLGCFEGLKAFPQPGRHAQAVSTRSKRDPDAPLDGRPEDARHTGGPVRHRVQNGRRAATPHWALPCRTTLRGKPAGLPRPARSTCAPLRTASRGSG